MMPCGATRPPLVDKGWECNGRDLVVVIPGSAYLPPSVIRADLLDALLAEEPYAAFRGSTHPLPPGEHDHLHLVVKRDQA